MIRRPPRSTPLYSSAASDVYKRQAVEHADGVGQLARVQLGQAVADRTADLLGVLRRCDLAGADGPDGLIGDHDSRGLLGRHTLERAVQLGEGVLDLLTGLADVQP